MEIVCDKLFALGCLWVFKSSVDSQSLVENKKMQVDKDVSEMEGQLEQPKKSTKPKIYKLHFGIKNFNNQPIISNQQLHTMLAPSFEHHKKKWLALSHKLDCALDKYVGNGDGATEIENDIQAEKEPICAMNRCYSTLMQNPSIPALYSLSFEAKDLNDAEECVKDIVSNISNNRSLKTFEFQIQQFYLNSKPLATKSQNIDWRLVELDFASKGLLTYNIEDIEDRPLVQTSTKAKFILVFFSSLILASILVLTREFLAQNWYRIVSKEN